MQLPTLDRLSKRYDKIGYEKLSQDQKAKVSTLRYMIKALYVMSYCINMRKHYRES